MAITDPAVVGPAGAQTTAPEPHAPAVSIVLPTFNEDPAVIDACIESIRNQTFADFECVIVDDSTRPESKQCLDRWQEVERRIRLIRSAERLGLAASLNKGVHCARGTFMARIDADDPCHPQRLSKQVAFLREHPDVDVVGTAMFVVDDAAGTQLGERAYPATHDSIVRSMLWSTGLAHPTVMVRRSSFERLGLYDTRFRNAEDLDLWLRWINAGARFANLPDRLVYCTIERGGRPRRHWRYNLMARVSNLTARHAVLQAVGILFAAAAFASPPAVVARVQRLMQLHRSVPA